MFAELFYAFIVVCFSAFCYYIAFIPVNIEDSEVRDKKLAANRARRLRKTDTKLPPPFPNGWYRLAASRDIKPGAAKHIDCIGENFVVFRSNETKELFVLDAYCPHLGASLGMGGIVKGDCIVCPFHSWKFDGKNGSLVDIPYSENISDVQKFAKIKKWISKEVYGFIFVWYHREHEEPWEFPVVEELQRQKYMFHGKNHFHVNAHIQEILENGADTAHFAAVHGPTVLAGTDLSSMKDRLWIGSHNWGVKWNADENYKHLANIKLTHFLKSSSFKFLKFEGNVIHAGPGFAIVEIDLFCGKVIMLHTVTPIEPLVQSIIHHFYAPWYLGMVMKYFVISETMNVIRDTVIWNSKRFVNPLFVKEEKQLKSFRKWYAQFYSENSKTFSNARENLEW